MSHPTVADALVHAVRSIQAIGGNAGNWHGVEVSGDAYFLSDGTWFARVLIGRDGGFKVRHIKIQRAPFRVGAAL